VPSVKWKGFASTTKLAKAKAVLMERAKYNRVEEVISVEEGHRRMLAEDIISPSDLPGFRRSAMDGYAVLASNTFGASGTSPKILKLVGVSSIGESQIKKIHSGECMQILTGAPVPEGADAVIRVEDTDQIEADQIEIYSPIPVGKNIAEKDEDVKKGKQIFKAGHVLSFLDLSLLISMGISEIRVIRKPRLMILSTGNELIPASSEMKIGQVYDSNRPALALWAKSAGADIIANFSCEDDPDVIMDSIARFLPDIDLLITTGGTSVGKKDYMEEVTSVMGEIWVHGISIRPGKPVILGCIEENTREVPIVALPGYPLAAFLNFENFVLPLLEKWTGFLIENRYINVTLDQTIPSKPGVRDFVRLRKIGVDERGLPLASLIRITGAGILSSIVLADYLLEVPEDVEGYPKGSTVEVRILNYRRY